MNPEVRVRNKGIFFRTEKIGTWERQITSGGVVVTFSANLYQDRGGRTANISQAVRRAYGALYAETLPERSNESNSSYQVELVADTTGEGRQHTRIALRELDDKAVEATVKIFTDRVIENIEEQKRAPTAREIVRGVRQRIMTRPRNSRRRSFGWGGCRC